MVKEKTPIPQSQQQQPGVEQKMTPQPESKGFEYKPAGKLKDKIAIVTGGDSGIGRAVSILFAKEGAHVAIVFKGDQELEDANETKRHIEKENRECLLLQGDLKKEAFCKGCVQKTIDKWGQLNILVNNAAIQYVKENIEEISENQLRETFETNIFSLWPKRRLLT